MYLHICVCSYCMCITVYNYLINIASTKQRSNLRKAITTDKYKLHRAIQKYCSVQEYIPPSEHIKIDENDIVVGEFLWSALRGIYCCTYTHTSNPVKTLPKVYMMYVIQ